MKRSADIEKNATEALRKVALQCLNEVITGTPVDTGRAKSNWQVGVNESIASELEPYFPGEKGSTASQNEQKAIDEGEFRIKSGVEGHGDVVFLRNNLDYIQKLNAGTSAQAPKEFVEDAIKSATGKVARATRFLNP
jgi:hypothetical protein